MPNKIEVWEIFQSIQGEGLFTGRWATFVRLCGCPVGCDFCDTPEAWDKGLLGYADKSMAVCDVYNAVVATSPQLVVFTGGEPLLQAEAIREFMEECHKSVDIQIETSGVVPLSNSTLMYFIHQTLCGRLHVTCSPKSRHEFDKAYLPIIKEFKFLADCDGHVIIPKELNIEANHRLSGAYMVVQPITYDDPEQNAMSIDTALKFVSRYRHIARLSVQVHKFIGAK